MTKKEYRPPEMETWFYAQDIISTDGSGEKTSATFLLGDKLHTVDGFDTSWLDS